MSDKPSFLQGLPLIHHSYIDRAKTKSGESLRAVDKAVGRLITAMGPRMKNTLIIYMSDNGVQWGEHRETDKNKPYRWSTDVPLMMRWDGHIPSGESAGMAANVDVTATILDAAGIPNALDTEGVSMLSGERKSLVLEALDSSDHPSYCGVRTDRWLYVEYTNNLGSELYDYRDDPLELRNRVGDHAFADRRRHLKARAKNLCSPVPPGFTWSGGH